MIPRAKWWVLGLAFVFQCSVMWTAYCLGHYVGFGRGLVRGWDWAVQNCLADKRNCRLTTDRGPAQ